MRVQLRHKQRPLPVDIQPEGGRFRIVVDDSEHVAEVQYLDPTTLVVRVDGRRHRVDMLRSGKDRLVAVAGEVYTFSPEAGGTTGAVATLAPPEVVAPMPGKVLQMLVRVGDHVDSGDPLLILEAMKMENRLVSEAAGTVKEVRVAEGEMVEAAQVLVVMQYDESDSA
jgi:biotin carboxyl carrier protein